MLNKIISSMSEAIYKEFGDDYEIYTEDIEQGLKEPCFSIKLISPSISRFRANKYYRSNSFCVYYFPKASREECFDVQERLIKALEYISLEGDLIRGTKMSAEMSDGVLLFMLNYDLFVNKEELQETFMETLKQTTDVRKVGG